MELEDRDGMRHFISVSDFSIGSESQNYSITENITNEWLHPETPFSTLDKDNSKYNFLNCPLHGGGWWHNICYDKKRGINAVGKISFNDSIFPNLTSSTLKIRRPKGKSIY